MGTLTPTETLYESRLFEALLRRLKEAGKDFPLTKIFRQVHLKCRGHIDQEFWQHRKGKLWIVDFYLWPHFVVEVDGHDVNEDRDWCIMDRGLFVAHIPNAALYKMEDALHQAGRILQAIGTIHGMRDAYKNKDLPRLLRLSHILGARWKASTEISGISWRFPAWR